MKKLDFDPAELPLVEQFTENNGGNDDGDDDDDEDPRKKGQKIVFEPGHIRSCWGYLRKLPAAFQPQFCIQPKMSDCFIDIREEALMRILWGREAGPAGEVWEGSEYLHQWAKTQVKTSFGNIIDMLFIGKRDEVRSARKHQTTYGKRTTTMGERSSAHPDIYGQGPLARYFVDRVNYKRAQYNASILTQSPSSSSSSPLSDSLSIPTPRQGLGGFRYALNNYIRTDGHQLQLLGYDLTQDRKAPGQKIYLRRIEKLCPTRQSIVDTFGQDMESVVVIGIDPGEVVSGAFCIQLDENSALNLVVKRSSLYQPTLAFRSWGEEWKRQHPQASPSDKVDSRLWTRRSDGVDRPTTLPSLHDLENALHPAKYGSWNDLASAHKQYFELEPIIHGFYSSAEWKRATHQHRMAKLSEQDLAVAGVLKMIDAALEGVPMRQRKVFFALGNGMFRTGLNLTSMHTTFLRRLLQKARCLMLQMMPR